MTRLDTTTLRYFVRVIETGTIAAAAEREHLTAAAISKRLSELEELIGLPLLMRNNKGVIPTEEGSALLLLARRALNELDQIPTQIQNYRNGVRGLVRIWASTSATTQFLPAQVRSFLDKYPDVQVMVEEESSTKAIRAVTENAADIGIFVNAPQVLSLKTFPYKEDRLAAIVSIRHPAADRNEVNFSELLDNDFIGFSSDGAIHHSLARAASECRKTIKQRIQVNTFESLSLMVSESLGIGVLPESVAQRNMSIFPIKAISLRDAWAQRSFQIGVRSVATLPQAARLMLEHLRGEEAYSSRPHHTENAQFAAPD